MNTTFCLLDRQLELARYPADHQHKSLQAWDSADELLISQLAADQKANNTAPANAAQSIILNDDFGALGVWYADTAPIWYSDSWIAHKSLAANLQANDMPVSTHLDGLVTSPVQAVSDLAALPDAPAQVLIKIPRTLALLEEQLIALGQVVTPATKVIAAGKVKTITRSVLGLFERYLGPTSTSLAQKKSRLIFCTPDAAVLAQPARSPYPTIWQHPASNGQPLTIANHANVFSRQSVDIGARLMLEHMHVTNHERVIDLGCGNGILGLNALAQAPQAQVTFVDESFMALASAKDNVQHNFASALAQCRFVASNCLEQLLADPGLYEADKILCNPPFHQQNAITDHIAWQMFHDSKALLRRGGHLLVVANRHLQYHTRLKRLFGGVKVLASNRKFVILSAAKR